MKKFSLFMITGLLSITLIGCAKEATFEVADGVEIVTSKNDNDTKKDDKKQEGTIKNAYGEKDTKLWKAEVTYKGDQQLKKFIGEGTEPGSIFHVKLTYKGDMKDIQNTKTVALGIEYNKTASKSSLFSKSAFKGNVLEKDLEISKTALKEHGIVVGISLDDTNKQLEIDLKEKNTK